MILRGDFSSKTLRASTNIQILIPDGGEPPFKIVYLLHGLHGNQGTWLDYTMLPYFAREYNTVFVMPEVGRSFYTNQKYGRRFFDYVSDELPSVCRRNFNISAEAKDTAAIGCSMGGFGALRMALARPGRFGFCGTIAPAALFPKFILKSLRDDSESYRNRGPEEEETFKDLLAIYGDALEYNPEYDPFELVKNYPADAVKPVIYAACGTRDVLYEDSVKFNEFMKTTGFNFTYEEWDGRHDWYFFGDALKKALEFWYKL